MAVAWVAVAARVGPTDAARLAVPIAGNVSSRMPGPDAPGTSPLGAGRVAGGPAPGRRSGRAAPGAGMTGRGSGGAARWPGSAPASDARIAPSCSPRWPSPSLRRARRRSSPRAPQPTAGGGAPSALPPVLGAAADAVLGALDRPRTGSPSERRGGAAFLRWKSNVDVGQLLDQGARPRLALEPQVTKESRVVALLDRLAKSALRNLTDVRPATIATRRFPRRDEPSADRPSDPGAVREGFATRSQLDVGHVLLAENRELAGWPRAGPGPWGAGRGRPTRAARTAAGARPGRSGVPGFAQPLPAQMVKVRLGKSDGGTVDDHLLLRAARRRLRTGRSRSCAASWSSSQSPLSSPPG